MYQLTEENVARQSPSVFKARGHLDFRFLGCFYFGVGLDWKKACLKLPALEETDKGSAPCRF